MTKLRTTSLLYKCLQAAHMPWLLCDVQVELPLSLGELYTGLTKKMLVTRRIVDGASGRSIPVQETLEINVQPGW